MKKVFFLVISAVFPFILSAQNGTTAFSRQFIFKAEKSISGLIALSPDGQWVAFQQSGALRIQPAQSGGAQQVLSKGALGWWTWTAKNTLLFAEKGSEGWTLQHYDLSGSQQKDMTPFPFKGMRPFGLSYERPDELALGFQSDNKSNDGVFVFNLNSGKADKIGDWEGCTQFWLDAQLQLRAAIRPNEEETQDLLIRSEKNTWEQLVRFTWNEGRFNLPKENAICVSNDGSTLWFVDSEGENTAVLKSADLKTKAIRKELDAKDADLYWASPTIDLRTGKPQALVSWFGETRRHYLDPSLKKDFDWLKKQHNGDVSYTNCSADGQRWLIRYLNGAPAEFFVYDRNTKTLDRLFSEMPEGDGLPWALRYPFTVKARDGQRLPCHLYLPAGSDQNKDGLPDKPLPTILYVHGGPWVNNMHNNWFATRNFQLLADRGYAVIWAEFRGVPGFGKDFLDAGNEQFGGLMHTDILDIAAQARKMKIVEPGKFGMWGWSYGAYATLAALAYAPAAFDCGVAMYGVYDLETFCRNLGDDTLWKTRTGNVKTAKGRALLRKHSPSNYLDNVTKPILLTHGSLDDRTPQSQTDSLVVGLTKANKAFSYFYYPDEPHDYQKPESWISFWAIAEDFLSRYLGGSKEAIKDDMSAANYVVQSNGLKLEGLDKHKP